MKIVKQINSKFAALMVASNVSNIDYALLLEGMLNGINLHF